MSVVDFEGFVYENRFIIKEISFYSLWDGTVETWFIKSPFLFLKNYSWLMRKGHGIPWYYGNRTFRELCDYLNRGDRVFYVKGYQKTKWLNQLLDHNYAKNLENFGCPKYVNIKPGYPRSECSFHSDSDHCAHNKVFAFGYWLKNLLT